MGAGRRAGTAGAKPATQPRKQVATQVANKADTDDTMTAKAPNILIVMADQMAPAFLPIYGHALARAPNMQELARGGVVFESAYCNSPLCSPSRASFMSERFPPRIPRSDNPPEVSADIPTL